MKLVDFHQKYSKDQIKKHFTSYITDEQWELHKDRFLLFFVASNEKELPRSFINENIHLLAEHIKDPKELEYKEWSIFSAVIHNYPLGDKLLEEYGDKISWSSISSRKDLTVDFYNQHKDKIIVKDIHADLGEKFIEEHLQELNPYDLKKMKLTLEQAEKLIVSKKAKLNDFWNQAFFTKEFALEHIKRLPDSIENLNNRFKFSFDEKIAVLKTLDTVFSNGHEEWNTIIGNFMESGELSLEEKKEIKWLAWI